MQPPEADLRTFVGPNADYYLQGWRTVKPDADLQRLRWNWPAFFLNIVWLLYRRMYRYFWIGFGVLGAIGFVEGFAEALLHFKTPAYMDFAINFTIAYWFGSYGTWYYYRHAAEQIGRTRVQLVSADAIARAGGVRLLLPVVVGVVIGVGALATTVLKFGPNSTYPQ